MESWEGAGRIAGKTRVEGVNTAGIPVEALHRMTGRIVKTVTSDSTGSFEINGLNSMHLFDVISRPPGKNAVISDSRTPVFGGRALWGSAVTQKPSGTPGRSGATTPTTDGNTNRTRSGRPTVLFTKRATSFPFSLTWTMEPSRSE